MVKNFPLVNSMLTFCKNVNVPEIIQTVEGEQGAAAGPTPTSRRWLHDMSQHKSMIDPELPVEHDCNFLKTFCTAFETLNPGSIAKIYTTEVNDEERFDGVCCVSGHKSSASFERIFVHSLWMPALSSTNKTTSLYPVLHGFKRQPSLPCSLLL